MRQATRGGLCRRSNAAVLILSLIAILTYLVSEAHAANPPDRAAILVAEKNLLKAMIAERASVTNPSQAATVDELICRVQCNIGDIAGAVDSVSRIPIDSLSRNACLADIAGASPRRVDAVGRKLMEQLPEPYRRRFAAAALAADGNIDGAIATLNQIDDPQERIMAICDLASKLIADGEKQQGRQLCQVAAAIEAKLQNIPTDKTVLQTMESLTRADDAPAAINLLYRLSGVDQVTDEKVLAEIARWQGWSGDLDGARATMAMLADSGDRSLAYFSVLMPDVILHAKAGDFLKAKELAAAIKDDSSKNGVMTIAIWQARDGDWPGVQETLSIFPDSLDKANHFLIAALDFAEEGYFEEMKKAIALAMSMKDKPRINNYESFEVSELVAALEISGDPDAALKAANLSGKDDEPLIAKSRGLSFPRDAAMRCRIYFDAADYSDMGNLEQTLYFQIPETQLYQIFPETVDANLPEQIKPLLAMLDSDFPEEREKATVDLDAIGPPAIVFLARLDPAKLSPEQQARIRYFSGTIRLFSSDEIATHRRDPIFLSQAIVNEDRGVRAAALELLQKVLGHPIDFNLDADIEARRDAVRALHLFAVKSSTQP